MGFLKMFLPRWNLHHKRFVIDGRRGWNVNQKMEMIGHDDVGEDPDAAKRLALAHDLTKYLLFHIVQAEAPVDYPADDVVTGVHSLDFDPFRSHGGIPFGWATYI